MLLLCILLSKWLHSRQLSYALIYCRILCYVNTAAPSHAILIIQQTIISPCPTVFQDSVLCKHCGAIPCPIYHTSDNNYPVPYYIVGFCALQTLRCYPMPYWSHSRQKEETDWHGMCQGNEHWEERVGQKSWRGIHNVLICLLGLLFIFLFESWI